MIVQNPFCKLCEGDVCWRAICRVCGRYTVRHVEELDLAKLIDAWHHCYTRKTRVPA